MVPVYKAVYWLMVKQKPKAGPPWLKYPELDWSPLTREAELLFVKKRTIIYMQNIPNGNVYIVKSGQVKLSVSNVEGVEKILYIAEEGTLFGEVCAISGEYNCAQATTLTDTLLYVIKNENFMDAIHSNMELADNVMRTSIRKIRVLTSRIETLTFLNAYDKVVDMLLYLTEEHGVACKNGTRINMKFTQQEVASLLGTNRVTIANVFGELTRQGLIYKANGYIVVCDPATLAAAKDSQKDTE